MKYILNLLLLLATLSVNATVNANTKNTVKVSLSPVAPQKITVKQQSHSVYDVWLDQFNLSLYQDLDHDGYYQNLKLNFDLDTRFTAQQVYVELWLTGPSDESVHLYTSETIALHGDSSSDSQQIEIQFVDGLNSDFYQLEFVVIDSATSLTIFSLDQYDELQLQDLMLEGLYWDQEHNLSVYSAKLDLVGDSNNNGFYQGFLVALDIDISDSSAQLIAQFYLDNQLLFTSDSFFISGNRISDKQYFDVEISQGLTANYYDLDIHIVDATTLNRRHQVSAIDWVEFTDLPLESSDHDNDSHSGLVVGVEHTGGSFGWWSLGLLILALGRRLTV